jgi:predicted outer membrane repeat protein
MRTPWIGAALLATTLSLAFPASASLFIVNTAAMDLPDVDLTDGRCGTGLPWRCTLRAAVMQANHDPGPDQIVLATAPFTIISLGRTGYDDTAEYGDLDITDDVSIRTSTVMASTVWIQWNPAAVPPHDRVFHVLGGVTLTLDDVAVTGGIPAAGTSTGYGGGVMVEKYGTLVAIDTTFSGNQATYGGAIASRGQVDLEACTFAKNSAEIDGGSVYVDLGTLSDDGSAIFDSNAGQDGGGIALQDATATLLGTEIYDGYAGANGGGVALRDTTADLAGVQIYDNYATEDGGGLSMDSSILHADGVQIGSGNEADLDGGGLYGLDSDVTMVDCGVGGNLAGEDGGGVCLESSQAMFERVDISRNEAGVIAGGLAVFGAGVVATDTTVSYNNAPGGGGGVVLAQLPEVATLEVLAGKLHHNGASSLDGGGLVLSGDGASARLEDSSVHANLAPLGNGGGIHVLDHAQLDGERIAVFGNQVNVNVGLGGGICQQTDGEITLRNATLSGNLAQSGGGLYSDMWNAGDRCALSHVTVAANTATAYGGGIYVDHRAAAGDPVQLRGVIVGGNTASTGPDCLATSTVGGAALASDGFSLIGDITDCGLASGSLVLDAAGGDLWSVAPLLSGLGLHGGTTPNHNLLLGSPAIGAGSSGGTCWDLDGNVVAEDQRGVVRPGGAECDIGAIEAP